MLGLIDSHCHLTSPELLVRIDDVIDKATRAGVSQFVTIATDLADAAAAFDLASRFSQVHVVCGIHPHQAGKVGPDWDGKLQALAERKDVHAIGEMGLDYHYDFADRSSQHAVFRRQLEISTESKKPVVIHCREAHEDTLKLLAEFPSLPNVVFHCFTGTLTEAREILDRGYWLSLTGVVTFKKSDELREVARLLPAERVMVETDCPYLSPEPVRSVRPNEPAYLIHTAACIAQARGLTLDDLTNLSASNTRRFFNLPVR